MWRFPLSILLACLCFPAFSQESPYRAPPWHLIDVWWTLSESAIREPVREVSVGMTVEKDPGQSVPIYVAPIGLIRLDGVSAYAGLQNDMNRPGKGKVGRGMIFSRWGERRSSFIREVPEGYSENADHEGGFIGVRRPLAWGEGTYETKLRVTGQAGPDGASWVRYEVCLVRSDCTAGGELGFARPPEKLGRQIASFVEVYGKPIDPERIPHFAVTFHPPRINGAKAGLDRITANYPANVPFVARATLQRDGSVRVDIGAKRADSEIPAVRGYRVESFTPPN